MFTKDPHSIFSITGLGGVGKTQIAIEIAYRVKTTHVHCSIFWVQAITAEGLRKDFVKIADRLDLFEAASSEGENQAKKDARELVRGYLEEQGAGQWLLIIDNIDDLDLWTNEISEYLPRGQNSCVLCTTRQKSIALKITPAIDMLEIHGMDQDMAMGLLGKYLLKQQLLANRVDALRLLERLTYLPLAVVQAAAYINQTNCGISRYLELLNLDQQELQAVELLEEDFYDEFRSRESINPVITTWLISFERIRQQSPLAAEYLSFMSCVEHRGIPEVLLPPADTLKKMTDAIGVLDAYSFVTRREELSSLDMHRLVHLATRYWLRKQNLLGASFSKVIRRLEQVLRNIDGETCFEKFRARRLYTAHIRRALLGVEILRDDLTRHESTTKGQKKDDEIVNILTIEYYNKHTSKEEKLDWCLTLFEEYKKTFGDEHPTTLIVLSQLGRSHYLQKDRDVRKIEELLTQLLSAQEKVLRQNHPEIFTTLRFLFLTYKNQGEHYKMRTILESLVRMSKQQLEEADSTSLKEFNVRHLVGIANNLRIRPGMTPLAGSFVGSELWSEIDGLCMQAIALSKEWYGPEHTDTIERMYELAIIYFSANARNKVESLLNELCLLKQKISGPDHESQQAVREGDNIFDKMRTIERWMRTLPR